MVHALPDRGLRVSATIACAERGAKLFQNLEPVWMYSVDFFEMDVCELEVVKAKGTTRAEAIAAWRELKKMDVPKDYASWVKAQRERKGKSG